MAWNWTLPRKGTEERKAFLQDVLNQHAQFDNTTEAALFIGVPRATLMHWLRSAATEGVTAEKPKVKVATSGMPKGIRQGTPAYSLKGPRKILLMSDMHVPYHDDEAIKLAIEDGLSFGADTVILNGDCTDCAPFSNHEKKPDERMSWEDQKRTSRAVLKYISEKFPKAERYYKEGNHEMWLPRYLARQSPEAYASMTIPSELMLSYYGYTWIENKQRIKAGRLYVIHGNEYRGGGGVNPARNLYLKAGTNVICGDKHKTDDYRHKTIGMKVQGAWVVGCLCHMEPDFLTLNQWNLGYALIEVFSDGNFRVQNRSIIDGKLY
jgi:hypothetical protein